ncbi:HupE/UreJ family protein [Bradyrhizobium ontarionense]|uniref:HupE/UreJ family protein n=1 Tax=Bradyrhizobium ontarionense TaxID=2898149 RepID=A0ABY3RI62_9BRAD|nr:HupE/UreJ family protein [Bradyrhizobium sp. A19]UFZ07134.1 HupE/UreJ family protein [Bradyrhizobium sp. A19]
MICRVRTLLLAATLLLTQVQIADAHIVSARLGDFYAGALHPLLTLQDVVVWAALGLLAGTMGAASGRWLVVVFPLGLCAGLALAVSAGVAPMPPIMDAATILILGLLLAASLRIPLALLCAMAFALGVMRGAANAGELLPQTDRLLYAAGLACAGYVVITLVMALALTFRRPDTEPASNWRGIAVRAVGGWVAAVGLMMAGLSLAS